jgi:hypothetical protein
MTFTFLPGNQFSMSLDEALQSARPVLILDLGRKRKVQSWVVLV